MDHGTSSLRNAVAEQSARLPLVSVQVEIGARTWSLNVVQNQDALVDAFDDFQHLPYGFLIWESAIGLARYLAHRPQIVSGKNVLELGCGVGLPGLVARSLGGIVTQTDHQPGVLTFARQNAAANGINGVNQLVADWRNWNIAEKFEVIIGADILYERGMHFFLEQIFRHNLAAGGLLLIADPGRPQAVEFMAELEKSGWQMELETMPVRLEHESVDAREVEVALISGVHTLADIRICPDCT